MGERGVPWRKARGARAEEQCPFPNGPTLVGEEVKSIPNCTNLPLAWALTDNRALARPMYCIDDWLLPG